MQHLLRIFNSNLFIWAGGEVLRARGDIVLAT